MKLLAYILLAYLTLLLVVPCCAFDQCSDDKAATTQTADHQGGDEDDCGTCSPFFSCEGCASMSVHAEPVYFNHQHLPVKQVYADHIPPLLPETHYEFWRPPQLS